MRPLQIGSKTVDELITSTALCCSFHMWSLQSSKWSDYVVGGCKIWEGGLGGVTRGVSYFEISFHEISWCSSLLLVLGSMNFFYFFPFFLVHINSLFEAIRPFLRRMFVRCKKSLQRDVILYGLLLLTNRSNSSLLLLPSNDAQITLFFNSLFFDIQYSLSLRNKLFAGWWEIILSSKEKNSLKSS